MWFLSNTYVLMSLFPKLGTGDSRVPVATLLDQLQTELTASKIQNIQVHSLTDAAIRKMKGNSTRQQWFPQVLL